MAQLEITANPTIIPTWCFIIILKMPQKKLKQMYPEVTSEDFLFWVILHHCPFFNPPVWDWIMGNFSPCAGDGMRALSVQWIYMNSCLFPFFVYYLIFGSVFLCTKWAKTWLTPKDVKGYQLQPTFYFHWFFFLCSVPLPHPISFSLLPLPLVILGHIP